MEDEKKTNVDPTPNPSENEGDNNVGSSDLENEGGKGANETPNVGEGAGTNDNSADGKGEKQPKQTREEDAANAERRRMEKARAEEAQKLHDEQIRKQAEFDVKSGQVTADELKDLGIEKVADPDQLFLVEKYRKAKSEGKENPTMEAYKALSTKVRDDRKAESEAAQAKEKAANEETSIVAKEQAVVKAKYGKTTGDILRDEPDFKDFFDQFGKAGNFDDCYSQFHKIKGDSENMAKKQGIPPTSGTGKGNEGNAVETDEQFEKRTKAKYGKDF